MSSKTLSPPDAAGGSSGTAIPPQGRHKSLTSVLRWVIVVGVLLAIVAYVAFLLLNEDVRREYYMQRVTTLILTLGVAVILFVAVPSSATISTKYHVPDVGQKAFVLLGGGAAFFYLLLPRVFEQIHPKDLTISGNIYYQPAPGATGLRGVRDVVVQVPETDQRSRKTEEDGRFTITNINFKPDELNALYSELTYPFKLEKLEGGRYQIIPRPVESVPSPPTDISASKWIDLGNKCPATATAGYSKVKQFVLNETVPAMRDYKNMIVKMQAQGAARIVGAQKEKPDSGYDDQIEENPELARQWSVPVRGDRTELKLSVCLGVKGRGPAPERSSLKTEYWFEQ